MKRYGKKRKSVRRFLRQYINGTKGVISLFLAILMLPFVSIGGALLNAARVDSAVAIFDEALCNASNSTLGTYDSFLRTRFGLLAMSQDTSGHVGYTVQDLISETFEFYMEQNVAALSNTYVTMDVDALGIYPLADTSVLLSEVLEYGKYAVPTKIIIDGLCINDIIGSLFSGGDTGKDMIDKMTHVVDATGNAGACQKAFNEAGEKLGEYGKARELYIQAYSGFKETVDAYNSLLGEMSLKLKECEQAVSEATDAVEDAENDLDGEDETKDPAAYDRAEADLDSAKSELETAEAALEAVRVEYVSRLESQRAVVIQAKEAYAARTGEFAEAVREAGTAVAAAQKAFKALNASGEVLMADMGDMVSENRESSRDSQSQVLSAGREAAEGRGDTAAAGQWQAMEAEFDAQDVSDVIGEANSSAREVLGEFAVAEMETAFTGIHERMSALQVQVEQYPVAEGYEAEMPDAGGYFQDDTVEPVTKERLEKMLKDLAEEVVKSSFLALADALVGFISALFEISAWYDPDLDAVLSQECVDSLPSRRDRSAGSPYCLQSEFDAEDSGKSNEYKKLLASYYSGEGAATGSGEDVEQLVADLRTSVDKLSGSFREVKEGIGTNIFAWIKELADTICNLLSTLGRLVDKITSFLQRAVEQKILLTGYVAYNVPNRTTYEGSALTGAEYDLPDEGDTAFYGAEAEYIMKGHESETKNQSAVFNNIWLIRVLYDLLFVVTNKEVHTIADAAGAPTFGIGAVVVFVLYIVAEPFVDTMLLVNGGKVPIWKGTLYLTPSGIDNLIKAITELPFITDAGREAIEGAVNDVKASSGNESGAAGGTSGSGTGGTSGGSSTGGTSGGGTGGTSGGGAAGGTSGGGSTGGTSGGGTGGTSGGGSTGGTSGGGTTGETSGDGTGGTSGSLASNLLDSLTFDYTKTILFAMLFEDQNKMLDRLADVIQMEAAYQASNEIGRYAFDLDHSYTYLRSSGNFTMNEFIPISDRTGIRTKYRIVYRGY